VYCYNKKTECLRYDVRAAEDAVSVHERVVGQGREKWPGIGKGERLDQNLSGTPSKQRRFVAENLRFHHAHAGTEQN